MFSIQQRRERTNRQINERLRALMAAYKTLGGSLTGDLNVDPRHLRDVARRAPAASDEAGDPTLDLGPDGSERKRRIRDNVEAALSDIVLLGTEEQVRLAVRAANELVAGHPVRTQELVVSLRDFIRDALDLAPIPRDLSIPIQGPARPGGGGRERDDGSRPARGTGDGGPGSIGGLGGGGGLGFGSHDEEHAESADHQA